MAWLTHLHGPGILELINEKVILFGPDKIEIFHPDGWARVNDLLVSNRLWENQYVSKGWTRLGKQTETADDENWDYMYQPGAGTIRRICRSSSCRNDAIGNTFYCADHQPPCRVGTCALPRLIGSEYCVDHQPLCAASLCASKPEAGEKYCLKHLALRAADRVNGSGGKEAVSPVPFRSGAEVVSGGADKPEGPSGVREAMDSMVEGGERPAVLDDPILQEQSTWARSINAKSNGSTHIRPAKELLNLIDNRNLPAIM
jgi:hypothetical protein